MKEALFILLVFGVILVLTAVRYRRQIAGMMQIWRSLKAMRQQIKQKQGRDDIEPERVAAGKLVNCSGCGTWVPESRAIGLRGGIFYCSSACLETTSNAR
jgi:hypothetical protein